MKYRSDSTVAAMSVEWPENGWSESGVLPITLRRKFRRRDSNPDCRLLNEATFQLDDHSVDGERRPETVGAASGIGTNPYTERYGGLVCPPLGFEPGLA